jgi:hypothetical protein
MTYPNGIVHSYGYDTRNRLTNLVVNGTVNGAILDIKIKNDKWDQLKSEGTKDGEPISGQPGQYQAFVPPKPFWQFVLYARFMSYPVN